MELKDGEKIKRLYLAGGGEIVATENRTIEVHISFHGNYDIPWAVVKADGEEEQWFSIKMVEGIEWAGDE